MVIFHENRCDWQLWVKVLPGAKVSAVKDVQRKRPPHGFDVVRIAIAAAPEKGKANTALLKFLAEIWELPARKLQIASAPTDRLKQILILSPSDAQKECLSAWALSLDQI